MTRTHKRRIAAAIALFVVLGAGCAQEEQLDNRLIGQIERTQDAVDIANNEIDEVEDAVDDILNRQP